MQETLFRWLRTHPDLSQLTRDELASAPGSVGVFSRGTTLLSRKTDILGRETRRQRLQLELQRHCTGDTGLLWLEEFSRWAEATAPALGSQPYFNCSKGQLIRADAEGVSRYSLILTFEFTQEV